MGDKIHIWYMFTIFSKYYNACWWITRWKYNILSHHFSINSSNYTSFTYHHVFLPIAATLSTKFIKKFISVHKAMSKISYL
jgi:hypothetical protein